MSICWLSCAISSAILCELGVVGRAEEWAWSSLRWLSAPEQAPLRLEQAPAPRRPVWMEGVNAATADVELEIIRESVRGDRPFGTLAWTLESAKRRL